MLNQLTQASELTISQLKEIAKEWGIVPTGDKRRKQTWIDAIESKQQELAQQQPEEAITTTETATTLWMPQVNEDGEQFKLGDYTHLSGTAQYELLQQIAVQDCCEQNTLYRSFYTRAIELGMMERDPGLDGGTIHFDELDFYTE